VLNGPKHFVCVVASAPALLQHASEGTVVLFGPRSALPGAAFILKSVPRCQLPLGFHLPCKIASESTKRRLVTQNLR
jgi:hypothetical protein